MSSRSADGVIQLIHGYLGIRTKKAEKNMSNSIQTPSTSISSTQQPSSCPRQVTPLHRLRPRR